jgi:hypothetical protein
MLLDEFVFFAQNYITVCRFQRTNQGLFPGKVYMMVGLTGLEPVTLRLSSACSNQLSYRPTRRSSPRSIYLLVELRRFELLTYSLQSYRSTN